MPYDISHIAHVNYRIPLGAEDKAKEFWCDLLGFTLLRKPPMNPHPGCWFSHGNYEVHVSPDVDFVPVKRAHTAYVVEGLSELAEKLSDSKITVQPSVGTLNEIESFFIEDPFGNRIEFMTSKAANVGILE